MVTNFGLFLFLVLLLDTGCKVVAIFLLVILLHLLFVYLENKIMFWDGKPVNISSWLALLINKSAVKIIVIIIIITV